MTEERSPWKGAAVGAGGGSLLAAALGYIYGHRGKWLAYDALTGGAVGGGLGYAVESSNKDRLDTEKKESIKRDTVTNSPDIREKERKQFAQKQDAAHEAFKQTKENDDSVLRSIAGATSGMDTNSEGWGNKAVQFGAKSLRAVGLPKDISEGLANMAAPIPRAILNMVYRGNQEVQNSGAKEQAQKMLRAIKNINNKPVAGNAAQRASDAIANSGRSATQQYIQAYLESQKGK